MSESLTGIRTIFCIRGWWMIGCAGLALVLGICSARFCAPCQGLWGESVEAEYRKPQSYSFSNIDHFQVSSLVTRLTSDVTVIQNSVSTGIRPPCRATGHAVYAVQARRFVINARLALVFFGGAAGVRIFVFEIVSHVGPFVYKDADRHRPRQPHCAGKSDSCARRPFLCQRKLRAGQSSMKLNLALRTESEKVFGLSSMNMAPMYFVMYGTILAILWFGGALSVPERWWLGS